jgi:hypothetical protein
MQLQYPKMIKHGMEEEIIFIVLGGEDERGCNFVQRTCYNERTLKNDLEL